MAIDRNEVTKSRRIAAAYVASGALLLCYGTVAYSEAPADGAGSETQSPSSERPDDQNTGLAEIVVTAQKRLEKLMSTPISVTALTAEELQKADLQSPSDLAQHVAALQVQTPLGDSNPTFSLRGVSMNDYNANQTGPIALYTDEVYRAGAPFFSDQLYDLERIEVLRGPQGTLYGKNATGGAINFITPEPGFDSGGFIRVAGGNYNRAEVEGAYQHAVTDTIAARFAFDYKTATGFEQNVYLPRDSLGGVKEHGLRLSILFRPVDNLKLVLRAATSATGPAPYADKVYATSAGIGGGLYSYFHNLYPASNPNTDYFPTQNGVGQWQTSAGTPGYLDSTSNDLSLKADWSVSQTLDLVSVTSFNSGSFRVGDDSDGSPLDALYFYERAAGQQYAEDLRLDYHGARISDLLGVYYSKDDLSYFSGDSYNSDIDFSGSGARNSSNCIASQNVGYYPGGCIVDNSFHQERVSKAIYDDGSYALTEALKVRLGVRYTRDELNVTNYSAYTLGTDGVPLWNNIPTDAGFGVPGSTSNVFAAAAPISDVFSKVTGRAGADYTFDNGVLVYGTVSRGYRTGAVNAAAFYQPSELTVAKPETLDAAELGAKGTFFDNRLKLATSAFLYHYTNQQVQSTNPINFAYQEVNIGKSAIHGAEVELTAKPVAALKLAANVAFLDTKIDEGVLNGTNLAGETLPTAPKWSGNVSLDWDAAQRNGYVLTISPNAHYTGSQYFFLGFPEGTLGATNINPYWLFDARASLAFPSRRVTVSLWGKNLADKLYYKTLEYASYYGFGPYTVFGAPRTFGAEVRYAF
jgi:iron complex outermembrane receptor protein